MDDIAWIVPYLGSNLLCYVVCGVLNCIWQREAHGILLLKRYFIMFVQEHAMGFLSLCNIGSKERHKSTTRNYVPWGVYTGCSRAHRALFMFAISVQYILL